MSNLTAEAIFNSIVLTWSVPEEPNGVILSYQVTYTVNGNAPVSTNTTNISVTAYTRVGEGEPATLNDTLTLQPQPTTDTRPTTTTTEVAQPKTSSSTPGIVGGVVVVILASAAAILVVVGVVVKR